MADVVKAEGLVLAYTDGSGNVYPFACAKDATITINKEFIELAPKTNGVFKEYISGRHGYTISGSGLVKLDSIAQHPITFFESFIKGNATSFNGYIDIIDSSNNLQVYDFSCFIQDLTLSSSATGFAQYNYSLIGNGPIRERSNSYTEVVASGKISAQNPATNRLIAVGYNGKWYYNYTVTTPSPGVYEILTPGIPNGTTIKTVYITI